MLASMHDQAIRAPMKPYFKEKPLPPPKKNTGQSSNLTIKPALISNSSVNNESVTAGLDTVADENVVKSTKARISEMNSKIAQLNQPAFFSKIASPSRSTVVESDAIVESVKESKCGESRDKLSIDDDVTSSAQTLTSRRLELKSKFESCSAEATTMEDCLQLTYSMEEITNSDVGCATMIKSDVICETVKNDVICETDKNDVIGETVSSVVCIVNIDVICETDVSEVNSGQISCDVSEGVRSNSDDIIETVSDEIGVTLQEELQGSTSRAAVNTFSTKVSHENTIHRRSFSLGFINTETPSLKPAVSQAAAACDKQDDRGEELPHLSEISPRLPSANCSTASVASVRPSSHHRPINYHSDSQCRDSKLPAVIKAEPGVRDLGLVKQQQEVITAALSSEHRRNLIVSECENNKIVELPGEEKKRQTFPSRNRKQVYFQFPDPDDVNSSMDSVNELLSRPGERESVHTDLESAEAFKAEFRLGSPASIDSSYISTTTSEGGSTTEDRSPSDRQSGSDNDEDEGVYAETFRYSKYKFVENAGNEFGIEISTLDISALQNELSPGKSEDPFDEMTTSRIPKRRGVSAAANFTDSRKDSKHLAMSYKVFRRHLSSAETYEAVSEKTYDVERTLILNRSDAGQHGYGFHLLENKPIIVSTVKPGSIAEQAGMLIGDRLITVNKTNVVFANLAKVLELAAQYDTHVELGLAAGRLCRDNFLCSGYLYKQEGLIRSWRTRWCALKDDNFLYFYKHEADQEPLGAICLRNYIVKKTTDYCKRCSFRLVKYGEKTIFLQSETEEDMNKWATAINAMNTSVTSDIWLNISSHNIGLPALSIKNPDCHGFLTKVGNRKKTWRRRYCVLKTACLYYYQDQSSSTAKGAAHLHGYKLEEDIPYSRKFGFSMVPPVPEMRTFYFYADNETDFKRWIIAMRKSVGKWVRVDGKSLSPSTANFD